MIKQIKVAMLPNAEKEAKVTRIYKKVGEKVDVGEKILDLEAQKGTSELTVQNSGIIKEILVEVGETVVVGKIAVRIDSEEVIDKSEELNKQDELNMTEKPKVDKNSDNNYSYLANMLKPKKKELSCDIAILGGGPGGYVAAIQGAKLGAKVILIEKDKIGGTCLNRGCIPTKAMVRSAEIFNNLKKASEFGCEAQDCSIDLRKVVARKESIVKELAGGIHHLLQHHKVEVVKGTGEIRNNNTIIVKTQASETVIHCKNIIIATGSTATKLPIDGLDAPNIMTSEEILDLTELPATLAIIGGGVIGMEFAFIFNSFGVDVSVLEYFGDCLTTLDNDICKEITNIALEKGIKLYTNSKAQEIKTSEDGKSVISFSKDKETKLLVADKVLVSVGRTPCLEGINTAKLGLEQTTSQKGIKVNLALQTNIPNIYAIGDVTEKSMLAHVASHQGIVAVKNIMGIKCSMDYDTIPNAIFTDPEIAVVGLSEKQADKEGRKINIGKFPFVANGKALTLGEPRGFIKLITEKETGVILGGAVIGPHATDLIAEITLAVKNKLTSQQIAETIHAHPTTAEVIHEAALATLDGSIHYASDANSGLG